MAAVSIGEAKKLMNHYGERGEPFLFLIDYSIKMPEVHRLGRIPQGIRFSTPFFPENSLKKKRPSVLNGKGSLFHQIFI